MSLIPCPACETAVSPAAVTCPRCGHPLQARSSVMAAPTVMLVQATKSRGTAALLAFFLGGVGVHKFYLNRPGMGLLYLLFFWTGIPALLGFFEGIGYACMGDAAFHQRYG